MGTGCPVPLIQLTKELGITDEQLSMKGCPIRAYCWEGAVMSLGSIVKREEGKGEGRERGRGKRKILK